ncbi:ATP-binding cassette, subfamily C (CFTR/MRP), member 4 [Paragonimus westermani]|uniref:ATP-binding cassette, subfamily C (CFTR/MRP), member 4 n=1 Tax=Paragonimus westermani TaxID=34504 RepID=A0A5J4P3J8_9TREM|nr:ATP-binding cassette, subfamily C (CFTR/MRP), member 4 [Paragonimus westermani]
MSKICPEEEAYFLSRTFYFWLNPLFSKARKATLTWEDIYDRPTVEGSDYVTTILEKYWNAEKQKPSPSFFNVIFKAHWWFILVSAFTLSTEVRLHFCAFKLHVKIICLSVRPFLMNKILLGFEDLSLPNNKFDAILYCTILIGTTLIALFLRNASFWMFYRMGMRLRVASSALIYRKILKLNQKAMTSTTAGQVINLLSSDAQRFELSFMFIHYGWIGPVQAVIVFWLMSEITFYPTLCAAAVMVFFIPMQSLMNHAYARIKIRIAQITDERIRILSDVINGIKIIKLHAWQLLFSKIVRQVRRQEMRLFLYVRFCQAFQFTQLVYQVKVTIMAMLLGVVLLHTGPGDPGALRSRELYTLLNYLNSLFLSLTLFLPMCIQYLFDTRVSCSRIQILIHFSALFQSSLLQAILGELPHTDGYLLRSSNVAYMPQLSWIFPGTLRDNILASLPYNKDRYTAVLRATTLDADLARLPHGDRTQVGERGVSLSGGQKARIGLARIAYGMSDFVMLDDPLAAVDARVANHLFNECICNFLSNRLRLLVTHQHHLLSRMDTIIVMRDVGFMQYCLMFLNYPLVEPQGLAPIKIRSLWYMPVKKGRIANIGTYNELLAAGIEFHTLQEDIPGTQAEAKSDLFSGLPSANEIHDTAVDHQLITFPNDSHSSRWYQPAGPDKRRMSSQPNPHSPRNCDDYRESSIWNTDSNTQAELAVTQSSEHIMQVTDPDFETLRKRTYSTSEVHDKSQRVRRKTTERESTRNVCTTTPRGSITSRFAFSLENAISPGIMDYLPSSTTELDEIDDERGPKNQGFFEELIETYEDTAEQEGWQRGSVSWRYYIILGQIGGGLFGVMFTGLLFIGTIANYAGCDVWLAAWYVLSHYSFTEYTFVRAVQDKFQHSEVVRDHWPCGVSNNSA